MSTFSPTERQRRILRVLSPTTATSVTALRRLTDVSAVTIRRDLTELAREGLVTRVHGGALRAPLRGEPQPIALRRTADLQLHRVLARPTAPTPCARERSASSCSRGGRSTCSRTKGRGMGGTVAMPRA